MGRKVESLKERGQEFVEDFVDDHPGVVLAGSYLVGVALAIPVAYVSWKVYAKIEAREIAKVLVPLLK